MPFCGISVGLRDEHGKNIQTAVLDKLNLTNRVGAGYNIDIPEQSGVDVMAFDQSKYIMDFMKENYDEVKIRIPKGKKAVLRQLATDRNITDAKGKVSMTRLIVEAIETQYGIDLSKTE